MLSVIGLVLSAAPTLELGRDCVYEASEPDAGLTKSQRCAVFVEAVAAAMKDHPLRKPCGDDWPDLAAATSGADVAGLEFWSLGGPRWLLRVRCTTGAYNEKSLVFLYDARRAVDEPVRLVLFPAADGRASAYVFARDFDATTRTLWELRKVVGDGSGGDYRRFVFDGEVPVLQEEITKSEADGRDGYSFERGQVPRGRGWARVNRRVRGCVATVASPSCTPKGR